MKQKTALTAATSISCMASSKHPHLLNRKIIEQKETRNESNHHSL
jgi:hypothetical protein